MYRIIFLPILWLFVQPAAFAQDNIKKYVQANTSAITTIEPGTADNSDLEAIGKAIGDAEIVMLGEQDHGDAPTFLAKTRLIQYLHEKMGFNVLAFESDFFGLTNGWDQVKKKQAIADSVIRHNIYPIWTYCKTMQQLFFQYIPSSLTTKTPLQLAGFDSQVYLRQVAPVVDSILRKYDLEITKSNDYSSGFLPMLLSSYKYTRDSAANNKITQFLLTARLQLQAVLPPNDFWLMVMDNLVEQNRRLLQWDGDYWLDMNSRDSMMAVNLRWLQKTKFPDEKIIVWAHNYHISKYAGHYPEDFLNTAKPMGSVFTMDKDQLQKTYVIGFTSYQGRTGRLNGNIYKVDKPDNSSFENWIDPFLSYAFVDFKSYNAQAGIPADNFNLSGAVKGNWYHKNHKAQWNRIFDGVFFIREMYPCKEY